MTYSFKRGWTQENKETMKMTPVERAQWSTKFILEIVSMIVIFGTIFASFKLQDYRTCALEKNFNTHVETQKTSESGTLVKLHSIETNQQLLKSDIQYIKDSVKEIKDEVKNAHN